MESGLGSWRVFWVHIGGRWRVIWKCSSEVNSFRADCRWFGGTTWGYWRVAYLYSLGVQGRQIGGTALGSMDNSLGIQFGR